MVRRDGAEVRRERIQQMTRLVVSRLNTEGGEISLSKMLAFLEYEYGLRREKLLEYLRIGEELNRFTIDEDRDQIRSINQS